MALQLIRPEDGLSSLGAGGLGRVPTLGGDVATSIPPAPGVPSATQDQQTSTTVVQAQAQAIFLPPPPYAVLQHVDPTGSLTTYFQTLNRKLGGYNAVFLQTIAITAPITGDGTAGHPLALAAASASAPGYLLSADWSTFNGKQNAIPYTTADNTKVVHNTGDETVAGSKTFSNPTLFSDDIVIPKTSGKGIEVDPAAPSFPWRDMEGLMVADLGGANSPTLLAMRGGLVRGYAYTTADKMDIRIHVPHDYLPGSDLFIHMHWSHNGTAISGNMVGTFTTTYAKGHGQASFSAEKSVTVTYATVNIATTPQYIHRIDETQLSSNGGSATLLDSAQIEPDGLLLINFTLTTLPTITGGTTTRVFVPFIDIHYQSTGIGTKQKAPNFYV